VANGLSDPKAGLKISAGHAIVEVPLILALFLGLIIFLQDENVLAVIGLVGGAFLLYSGISMLRAHRDGKNMESSKHGSIISGLVLTAANPYFLVWWATVGVALIGFAAGFGLWMLPVFIVVHLLCDVAYLGLVSFSVSKGKNLAGGKLFKAIYIISGVFLVCFALYFISGSLTTFLL